MEAKFKSDDAIKFTNTVEDKYTIGDEGRIDIEGIVERNGKYFYNIKSAGHLITDVPESDMEFVYSSVEKNVDEYLRKREQTKSFKDSDVRVGGSRKEMMAFKGMINAEDLDNIEKDKVIAKKLVKKDKVYPQINTTEQIDKGVSGGCLFLKMKARDFIWQTPPDTAQFRSLYVNLSQWVYELFDSAITMDDFEERRKLLINGIIRKALLVSNPEIEDELILQNKEYQDVAEKEEEYIINYNKASEKLYDLATKSDIPTWNDLEMAKAFPKEHEELEYWKRLKNIANQFKYNKILPLEYKFLHKLATIENNEDGEISLLTQRDLPEGEIVNSKEVNDDYILKYSGGVRTRLIDSVFGDRFSYFIHKTYRKSDNEVTYTVYEDAKLYEPFTQEQYDKIYQNKIKSIEDYIEKHLAHIAFLNDPEKTYREKIDYALNTANLRGWRWGRSKYTFAKMVSRNDIDDAIRLMEDIVRNPNAGFIKVINDYKVELNLLKAKYFVRDNNYAFLEKGNKERKKGERSELVINSGVPLSYIKRIGGVAVFDTDLDNNDKVLSFYKNILGITRITYGLSLPDKERSAHAKHYAQSIIDLSETLNWDVKALTGLGDLGILFAAAGHGRAMAHFSPDTNAVNLTRSKGDGSVCHEIGHYLDYNVARKFPNDMRSEKNHAVYGSFIHNARNISDIKIMTAMNTLMDFIVKGVYVTRDNEFDENRINKDHPVFKELLPMLPEFVNSVMSSTVSIKIEKNNKTTRFKYETINEHIKNLHDNWSKYLNYNYYLSNKTEVTDTLGAILNQLNIDSYEFQLSNKPYKSSYSYGDNNRSQTAFYLKNKNMKSPYWVFYWELFARGFECYIFDKMANSGRANNYLVSGEQFDRPEGIYPYGIERQIFYILYDNLFNVIKEVFSIPDFKAFRDERVDDYFILNNNDTEEESLVIDEQTKEIVSGDDELMAQKNIAIEKMIKLKELLSEKLSKNLQNGGQITIDENKLVENIFSFSK